MNQRIGITVGGQWATARAGLALAVEPVRSLYIHVPFCFHKCHYCDFYSFVDSRDRQGVFVDRLIQELEALGAHAGAGVERRAALETIFVGGGTPSLLRVELWQRLLVALGESFDLTSRDVEFTVECNPETVTAELMAALQRGGVNRVSVGAQSFDERHLKTLERWHDPANVQRALAIAADAGIERRNIDLIFGVPGQTLDEWERDLERATALRPGVEHISCYALTYEPNTAMTQRMKLGEFAPADDDVEADMYLRCVELLHAHGCERYEVSNFAKPGAECRHNMAYWRQTQWLAAGPSASAHVGGARWKNVPRLTDWMAGVEASGGYSPAQDVEAPDRARALAERLMMGLRLREGVDAGALAQEATALGCGDALERAARRQMELGLLVEVSGRWRVTDAGFLQADGVAAALMSAAHDAGHNENPDH